MHSQKGSILGWGSVLLMLLLIFDAKTALSGASEGIELCIRTVIPSLFPYFFLSGILNSFIAGQSVKLLRPIGILCGIPDGAEYLLLIGLTGGYPVGAQCISNACRSGALKQQDATRMLSFCSNAGPAFIFGMTSLMFPSPIAPWLLWLIQILCALITGMILPGKSHSKCTDQNLSVPNPSHVLHSAIKAMASVCGWVVIFRVLIKILQRWLLWLFPAGFSTVLSGLMELSNGCIGLNEIDDISARFVVAAVITVFGGICVGLQTVSVCQPLPCKMYFIGKLVQTSICLPVSMITASFLFPGNKNFISASIILAVCLTIIFFAIRKIKKYTGNSALYRV